MGKGTIISGGSTGLYQVQINYNRTRYDAKLAGLQVSRTAMVSAAAAEDDPFKKDTIELQITSIDLAIAYLTDNMPADKTLAAWCADLTEDLSGVVGTIEVPGELGTLQIQPGYGGNAAYDGTRDGQIMPTVSMNSAQAFYNLAMYPGWQKWQPTFRYATINSISDDTADITLEAAVSSQQGLGINQGTTLSDVAINYMDCNGVAFETGDVVLVKFEGQDYAAPKIVGFKDDPQPCGGPYLLVRALWIRDDHFPNYSNPTTFAGVDKVFVWDLGTNAYAKIPDGAGGFVEFPAPLSGAVIDFLLQLTNAGHDLLTVESGPVAIPAPPVITLGCSTAPPVCPHDPWSCSDSDSASGAVATYNGVFYQTFRDESITINESCTGVYKDNSTDRVSGIDFYDMGDVLELRNNVDHMSGYLRPNPGNSYGEVNRGQYEQFTDVDTTQDASGTDIVAESDSEWVQSLALDFMGILAEAGLNGYSNSTTIPTYSDDKKDVRPYNYRGYGPKIKADIKGYFSDTAMVTWVTTVYNAYAVYSGTVNDPEYVEITNEVPFDISVRTGVDMSAPAVGYASRTDGATPESFTSANTLIKPAFFSLRNYGITNLPTGVDLYGRALQLEDMHIEFYGSIWE